MANHKSAAKRDRQRIVRTARNRSIRTTVRNALKAARVAISEGDLAKAKAPVQNVSVILARAVTQGILHKNTAARTISRVQSALAKLA
jgi:small subunit ribosomal protein S20